MAAFCEEDDVRKTLQEANLSGPTGSEMVEPAIQSVSDWFARRTNGHWYDSGGSTTLVDTSAASAANVRLDVPNSPHPQRGQVPRDDDRRYPVTHNGPYARIPLPHPYVQTVTKLEVRQRDGSVSDWVADSSIAEGRGEDYYIEARGQQSYGRTYLYINANSLSPRYDYSGLLTLAYDYGLDADDTAWQDVRRGVAALAAAEVIDDDSVLAQIPDNGQLVGVQTQHQNLIAAANRDLGPYLGGDAQ
jgi:hypothetical protein